MQDGAGVRGRALTGCDGTWSRVREKIVGDGKPIVSGHIAYRAVLRREDVPADLWRPDVILWAGPRTHLVHYPLRRGELYNLVAVFHSSRYVEGWDAKADSGELWAHFKAQRPEVLRMLERIETWRMWVLCDREPIAEWSKRRVALLGDAAHPMLQYLAQGACMATEDAMWIAEKLAENPDDIPAAFRSYAEQRYLRTARVQIMARVYGEFYHARGPVAELRNQMLGARTPEGFLRRHRLALWRRLNDCVPGAAQHAVVRGRPGTVTVCGGPGAAVHRFALHRIRDTVTCSPQGFEHAVGRERGVAQARAGEPRNSA